LHSINETLSFQFSVAQLVRQRITVDMLLLPPKKAHRHKVCQTCKNPEVKGRGECKEDGIVSQVGGNWKSRTEKNES